MIKIIVFISGCFDVNSNVNFKDFLYVNVRCLWFICYWNFIRELLFDLNVCYGK